MIAIFLGPPGSGKGTQAKKIEAGLNMPQLSTGDMLRSAIKKGTKLGMEAKAFMDRGELVPDQVVTGLIDERIRNPDCKPGFILDGFPRTIPQADSLAQMLAKHGRKVDQVLLFDIADDEVVRRLSKRRTCSSCGAVFHLEFSPPKQEGVCDQCGKTALVQRDDDTESVIRKRLEVYHRQTSPLVDYYTKNGNLRKLDAAEDPQSIQKTILSWFST